MEPPTFPIPDSSRAPPGSLLREKWVGAEPQFRHIKMQKSISARLPGRRVRAQTFLLPSSKRSAAFRCLRFPILPEAGLSCPDSLFLLMTPLMQAFSHFIKGFLRPSEEKWPSSDESLPRLMFPGVCGIEAKGLNRFHSAKRR